MPYFSQQFIICNNKAVPTYLPCPELSIVVQLQRHRRGARSAIAIAILNIITIIA
ncbi:MAG: hypothetical protein ACXV3U_06930 [Halobacteriota archaeon]